MIYNDLFIEKDLPKPLETSELNELFKRKEDGDNLARELIIKHNMRLVLNIVRNSFFGNIYDQKELVSVGMIGLIKAVDLFDIKSGNKFSTFANPCIYNEIRMFLKIERKQCNKKSINNTISPDKEKESDTLEKILSDNTDIEGDYTKLELLKRIRELVDELPEKKRCIITKYFGFDDDVKLNQSQIAQMYNITPAAISDMKVRTLKKIEDKLYREGLIERKIV